LLLLRATLISRHTVKAQPMKLLCLFALLVLSIPLRVTAAQTDAPDCSAATAQADLNRCAFEDFLAANGTQAAVLKGLTRGLAAPDRQRLRTAQKSWITWRTAECEFETAGSRGGSAHELARWSCAAKLTRERTEALDKLTRCPEVDIACPSRKQ
jgi:uncharacterized protein YecT (DUF1311 family)